MIETDTINYYEENNDMIKFFFRKIPIMFMILIFFNGFLNNFINIGNLFFGTLLIDTFYILLCIYTIIIILHKGEITINVSNVILSILLLLFIVRVIFDPENTMYNKILSFRDKIFYMLIFIFIQNFIFSIEDIRKIKKWLLRFSTIISIFGILQFLLRDHLSLNLLTPKSDALFSYYGTNIIRATGLVGNPIIFANFELLFYSIFLTRFLNRANVLNAIYLIITMLALIFTFSRASYLGAFIITLIIFLIYYYKYISKSLKTYMLIFFMLILIILSILIFNKYLLNSFIFKGLILGNNLSVQGSNNGHLKLILTSLRIIKDNWLFGTGLGTQGRNLQSQFFNTDGVWLSTIIEVGIPTFVVYLLFMLNSIILVFKAIKKISCLKDVSIGFIVFGIYEILIANIVNSSYFGKIFYIMYWFIFGIIVSEYKLKINEIRWTR